MTKIPATASQAVEGVPFDEEEWFGKLQDGALRAHRAAGELLLMAGRRHWDPEELRWETIKRVSKATKELVRIWEELRVPAAIVQGWKSKRAKRGGSQ